MICCKPVPAPMESSSPSPHSAKAHATQRATPQPLDPSIKTVWTIKLGLFMAAALLIAFFYDLTHLFSAESGFLPAGVATGAVLMGGGVYCAVWPRLRYRFWRFAVRPEELYIQRGVLNRVRTIVPLRRVQHLDVSQDILEREFSLGRLIVHTAGSRSSDVVIPGLPLEEAESIRDEVKQYILDDPLMEAPV